MYAYVWQSDAATWANIDTFENLSKIGTSAHYGPHHDSLTRLDDQYQLIIIYTRASTRK
jgi:hypothetical protein